MRMQTNITHIFFLLCCHCLITGAFAQTHNGSKFHISGRIYGKDTGTIVLWYKNMANEGVGDTIRLRHGRFKFSGTVRGACEGLIWTDLKAPHLDHPSIIRFILEPRSIKILKVYDRPKVIISGSSAQVEKDKWDSYKSFLKEKEETGYTIADSLRKAGPPEVEQVNRTIDSVRKALSDLDIDWRKFLDGVIYQ